MAVTCEQLQTDLATIINNQSSIMSRLTAIEGRLSRLESATVYMTDRAKLESEINAIGLTVNIDNALNQALGLGA